MVRQVSLRWDLGIPTHAGIQLLLDSALPPPYLARERALSLASAPIASWGPAAVAAALGPWRREEPKFQHLLASGDLDSAWSCLASAARDFLSLRQGSLAAKRSALTSGGFVKQAFAPKVGRDGEALTKLLSAQLLILNLA